MRLRAGALITALLGGASSAPAAEADGGVEDPTQRTAASLYDEGARHYQVEEYDAAIDAFKRAYLLSANPGLLYNIAQAFRMKGEGHCKDARRYYKTYLEQKPKAADRSAVEALITKMADCAEREPAAATSSTEQKPPAAEAGAGPVTTVVSAAGRAPLKVGSLALGLGGLAVGLGGGALNVGAHVRFEALKAQCPCPPETWQGWRSAETVSWFLMVGGGAAALGGLVWALLPGEAPAPVVLITPAPLGVTAAGTF